MTRNVIFAAALLVLLSGCGATLETKTFHPATLRTFLATASDHATFSCFPVSCGLQTSGTGKELTPSQVTVGFAATYDDGTLPCNCWEWTSIATRGGVFFNTFKMPKKFTTAILVLAPTDVNRVEGSNASNDESGTISAIFLPQASWDGALTTVFSDANGTEAGTIAVNAFTPEPVAWISPFPMNAGSTFPASGFPVRKVGNNYEVDATGLVKDWIKSPGTNHGLMLVGRDESLPKETNQAWEANYHVTLRVLYNPDIQ
jgi:hypothetical protein